MGLTEAQVFFFRFHQTGSTSIEFFFRVVGIFAGLVWSVVGWKGESSGGYCKQSSLDCQALPNNGQGVGSGPVAGGRVSPCVVDGEGIDS